MLFLSRTAVYDIKKLYQDVEWCKHLIYLIYDHQSEKK